MMNTTAAGCRTLLLSLVIAVASVLAAPALHAQGSPPTKKVLIVWGGWSGHEPKQTVDIFAPWLVEQGFNVELSTTLDSYLDAEKMKGLALVVQAFTMGQITPQQEKGLLDAVRGRFAPGRIIVSSAPAVAETTAEARAAVSTDRARPVRCAASPPRRSRSG